MAADGSIRIVTKIDINEARAKLKQLQAELARADKAVEAAQKKLDKNASKIAAYQAEKARIQNNYNEDKAFAFDDVQRKNIESMYAMQMDALEQKYVTILDAQRQQEAALEEAKRTQAQLNDEVREQQAALFNTERAYEAQTRDAKEAARAIQEAERASKRFEASAHRVGKKLLSWSTAMLGVRGVIGILRKSVNAFLTDNETIANKLTSIWSAIGNALGPIIQRIINLIQTLFSAVAAFIKALTGVDIVANANAKALENQASATAGAGSAAEKAEKQLASFDEMNKLSDTSSSGGGGGSSAGSLEIPSLLDSIDSWLSDFAARLGMVFKDVFLDWGADMTGEDFAQKIITLLSAAAGGLVGFALTHSVGGTVIGVTIGALLGMIASAFIFDHDGVLSGGEILKTIVSVLAVTAGGLIGFFVGSGVAGAAIGVSIGFALAGFLVAADIDWDGTENAVRDLRNEVKECKKTFADAESTFHDTKDTIDSTAATAEWYVGKLEELEAAGLDTAEAHTKYKVAVDALNSLLPELNLVIDEETGLVEGGTQAIRDQIEAWKTLAVQEALTTRYKTELQAWADATVDLYEKETDLAELQEEQVEIEARLAEKYAELDLLTEQYNDAIENSNGLFHENAGLVNEMETAQAGLLAEISAVTDELSANEAAQTALESAMESGKKAIAGYEAKMTEAGDAMYKYMDTTAEMGTSVEDTVGEMAETSTQVADDMEKALSESSSSARANVTDNVKMMRERTSTSMRGMRSDISAEADTMESDVSGAWTAIQNSFSNWSSFWESLGRKLKNTFTDIGVFLGSAISGAVKNAINGVLSKIQSTINSAISLINGAIGVINKLPGVSVGYLSTVSLPRLARGGVANNPGRGVPAVFGEAGAEAVLPLERNTEWMDTLASKIASKSGANGQIVVPVYLSGKQIAKYVVDLNKRTAFATNNA